MMFASCNIPTAMIAYTFLLIAGIFAALSVNYYNRGTDHSQFHTIMNYVAIGVLGLLSVLAVTVVLAPFLKDRSEKRKTAKAAKKKAKENLEEEVKAKKVAVKTEQDARKAEANFDKARRQLRALQLTQDAARAQAALGSQKNPFNLTGQKQRAQNNIGIRDRW